MNEVISLLKRHRSIRRYKSTAVPDDHLDHILSAAQAASTSSNIQAYSVVVVKDPQRKSRLGTLSRNQQPIDECPVFLVWLADLNKIRVAANLHEPFELKQNTETLLLGTIDAALAAQNAAVAAESLGYGIVYIGGVRNAPKEISELLKLPQHVYPMFGMCLGVPDQQPDLRPRLPLRAFAHPEQYVQNDEELAGYIKQYDDIVRAYYSGRAGGGKSGTTDPAWSKQMLNRFAAGGSRDHMYDFLIGQGFVLK